MKKIMFNDNYGLTAAVLQGRKTMTRRVVKKNALKDAEEYVQKIHGTGHDFLDYLLENAPYRVGEVVAIAQRYKDVYDEIKNPCELFSDRLFNSLLKEHKGWSNKMFVKADLMPHHIRITDLKVERLQDIREADCMLEGIFQWGDPFHEDRVEDFGFVGATKHYDNPREAFAALIDKVSGRGTWDKNPWVFAYSFELVK